MKGRGTETTKKDKKALDSQPQPSSMRKLEEEKKKKKKEQGEEEKMLEVEAMMGNMLKRE